MSQPAIQVFDSIEDLFGAAAEQFAQQVKNSVALSGGSTPKGLFGRLTQEPFKSRIDWPSIDFYWGDERCVPPDHPDSNYRMAHEALLSQIPATKIHRMQGELDPHTSADQYERELPSEPLDLVLLGMGPDGHTASLFPHTDALKESKRRVVANYVPKLETWRVTFTYPELRRSRNVLFMVTGADKAESLKQVLQGPYQPEQYPSQLLREAQGTVSWMLDRAAAALL